jgi:1-acyl-sn-glycerol-3-phosphate acyltransferase
LFSINQITKAIYATYLTNKIGFKVRSLSDVDKKRIRIEYAETLLTKLGISISVKGKEKLNNSGPYLLVSNHCSIIDPLIIELALRDTTIYGLWVAKKELYNSFFFGMFVRNAGAILLDRNAKQMTGFFADIKENIAKGDSIFIFPEGTRNKSNDILGGFKKGTDIIARKSKLDILPVYIKTNANDVLMKSLTENAKDLVIDVEIGDIIPFEKEPKPLEESYRSMFGIS